MSEETKDNPGSFVTRAECGAQRGEVRADITTIKEALIGKNMRSGLVKECSDMKNNIKAMKKSIDTINNKREKKQELQEFSRKHRLALYVALIGAFSLIGSKIIEVVAAAL